MGATEICDGKDNNRDGQKDEGFDVGGDCATPAPSGNALGVCAKGGTWACQPGGGRVCIRKNPRVGLDELQLTEAPCTGWDWNSDGKVTKDPTII